MARFQYAEPMEQREQSQTTFETTDDKPSAMMLASMAEVRRRKTDRSMPKAASKREEREFTHYPEREQARRSQSRQRKTIVKGPIKREQNDACISYAEREDFRPKVKGQIIY